MKDIIQYISDDSDFDIDIMESDLDHIHILISSPPKLSPLSIVRRIKQVSTIQIWRKYGSILKDVFWVEKTFWTDGYFVSSIGNVSSDKVMEYIRMQG